MLYRADANWIDMALVGEEGVAMLNTRAGADLTKGFLFPFWQVAWGWIAVLATLAFLFLEWRAQARRRELLGVM